MSLETILGIGTLLVLGIQGWILWRQTNIINSQKDISKKQSLYLRRKENPKIELQRKKYKKDKILLYLTNLGSTRAVGIALKTEAYIIDPEIKKKEDKIWVGNRGGIDIDKQENLKDGGKTYSLGTSIIEVYHEKSDYPELDLNQSRIFSKQVPFSLYSKKDKSPLPSKNLSFKELIALLKKNKVIGCEIRISLIYKNLANKIVNQIPVDNFYIMPLSIKPKHLGELDKEDRLDGGMSIVPIHPFLKQDVNIPKSEDIYRQIDHGER